MHSPLQSRRERTLTVNACHDGIWPCSFLHVWPEVSRSMQELWPTCRKSTVRFSCGGMHAQYKGTRLLASNDTLACQRCHNTWLLHIVLLFTSPNPVLVLLPPTDVFDCPSHPPPPGPCLRSAPCLRQPSRSCSGHLAPVRREPLEPLNCRSVT